MLRPEPAWANSPPKFGRARYGLFVMSCPVPPEQLLRAIIKRQKKRRASA